MGRRIKYIESFSDSKKAGHNEDDIYVGKDFVAVIDGVSHKSSVLVNGKQVKIAQIIIEAIRKLDAPSAPEYAKSITFEEGIRYINSYIEQYLQKHGLDEQVGKMEATGIIYSRYHNQLWLVGDCRAVYDGNVVENPLRIDQVYIDIRKKIIEALLQEGYRLEELIKHDISRDIIRAPELLLEYIKNPDLRKEVEDYRTDRLKIALLECGFSEQEIEEKGLIEKYYNVRDLQKVLKNNPNMNSFGYAVYNGKYTEIQNCKVIDLPRDVKKIAMFSDGFQIEAFNKNKDIGYAARHRRRIARLDPLSIGRNAATHAAVSYSRKSQNLSTDDASGVIFEIEQITERVRDDER